MEVFVEPIQTEVNQDYVRDNLPPYRLLGLSAQLYAGARLGMWAFGREQELFYSTSPNSQELLAFLKLGDCLDYVYTHLPDEKGEILSFPDGIPQDSPLSWDRPVLLSDSVGLIWAAEHMSYDGVIRDALILLGPVFLSNSSMQYIESALRKRDISIQFQRQMARTLAEVPVLSVASLTQYVKMLHYTLTGEQIMVSEFLCQNDRTREALLGSDTSGRLGPQSGKREDPERILKGEQFLLQAVRDGNLNYRKIWDEIPYDGDFYANTGDALRDAKDMVLILNALCSRAAMDGGLHAGTVKEMERQYASEIEKCTTVSKLADVNHRMVDAYVQRVHKSKSSPLISESILESCDYIRANVTKPITVDDIAATVGYSPYYFTKKFYKETGVRVTDYIKQARVEYAKIALLTTRQSIQEISDSLQFGNKNYFSQVFREIVGVPPAAYREQGTR